MRDLGTPHKKGRERERERDERMELFFEGESYKKTIGQFLQKPSKGESELMLNSIAGSHDNKKGNNNWKNEAKFLE